MCVFVFAFPMALVSECQDVLGHARLRAHVSVVPEAAKALADRLDLAVLQSERPSASDPHRTVYNLIVWNAGFTKSK